MKFKNSRQRKAVMAKLHGSSSMAGVPVKEVEIKPVDEFDKPVLSEREVLLLKRRLNDKKLERSKISRIENGEGWRLTTDQEKKGLDWLMDKWKSPTGKERAGNPFGYREQKILENFDHFELHDFYPAGNEYFNNFLPIYHIYDKEGDSFEYYVAGGEIHIIG